MSIGDKVWEALTTVIKMNDRIVSMSGQMQKQQAKIEDLTERIIRLETALEIAMSAAGKARTARRAGKPRLIRGPDAT
jgi:hypothetical protein